MLGSVSVSGYGEGFPLLLISSIRRIERIPRHERAVVDSSRNVQYCRCGRADDYLHFFSFLFRTSIVSKTYINILGTRTEIKFAEIIRNFIRSPSLPVLYLSAAEEFIYIGLLALLLVSPSSYDHELLTANESSTRDGSILLWSTEYHFLRSCSCSPLPSPSVRGQAQSTS